jgi:hypothetical protein
MAALVAVGVLAIIGVLRLLRGQPSHRSPTSPPESIDFRPSPTSDASPVVVFETGDASLVPVISSLLTDAEIPFLSRGEAIQDLFAWGRVSGNNPVTGPVQFLVPPEHAEAARDLLRELRTEGSSASPANNESNA